MPTYDYECDACNHTFELFQYISEAPQTTCPACGTERLRRLFGIGAAVMFKGSGFYQTDYRSEAYKKAAESDKGNTDSKKSDGSSTASKSSEAQSGSKSPSKAKSDD